MVREQVKSGPGIVEWALPEDEIGDVRASVHLEEGDLDPDDVHLTWCPVCRTSTTMRGAVTPDGRRFDLCAGCGLLWHVDRQLGRAVAHRVAFPPPPPPQRVDTSDIPLGTVPPHHPRPHPAGRRRPTVAITRGPRRERRAPRLAFRRRTTPKVRAQGPT